MFVAYNASKLLVSKFVPCTLLSCLFCCFCVRPTARQCRLIEVIIAQALKRIAYCFFVPGNTKQKKNTPKRHKILLKRELLKGSRVVFNFKENARQELLYTVTVILKRSFFYPARNCIPMDSNFSNV